LILERGSNPTPFFRKKSDAEAGKKWKEGKEKGEDY